MTEAGPPSGSRLQATGEVDGDTAVIRLAGEMDLRSSEVLRNVADDLIENGARRVVLDCSELTFLDSGGLSVLVRLYQQLTQADGSFAMRGCDPFTRQVLEITGLSRFIIE